MDNSLDPFWFKDLENQGKKEKMYTFIVGHKGFLKTTEIYEIN